MTQFYKMLMKYVVCLGLSMGAVHWEAVGGDWWILELSAIIMSEKKYLNHQFCFLDHYQCHLIQIRDFHVAKREEDIGFYAGCVG